MRKRKTPVGLLAVLGDRAGGDGAAGAERYGRENSGSGLLAVRRLPGARKKKRGLEGCLNVKINGSNFKMGSKNVPIEQPFTFSGGFNEFGEFFYNSKGGISQSPNRKSPGASSVSPD